MGALAGQKGPWPALTRAVKCCSISVLTIPVARVPVPDRPLRQLGAQAMIDRLDGCENVGIVRCAQAEADQRKCIRADDIACWQESAIRCLVEYRRHARELNGIGGTGRSDANIMARNTKLRAHGLVTGKRPPFDLLIPAIGCLPQMRGFGRIALHIQQISSGKQRGDLDGKRKRAVACIFLPPVLAGRRAVCQNISRSAADHWHVIRPCGVVEVAVPMQHIRKQDRKGAFVHLNARPIGLAIQPEILRPPPRGLLHLAQIIKDGQSLIVITGR